MYTVVHLFVYFRTEHRTQKKGERSHPLAAKRKSIVKDG